MRTEGESTVPAGTRAPPCAHASSSFPQAGTRVHQPPFPGSPSTWKRSEAWCPRGENLRLSVTDWQGHPGRADEGWAHWRRQSSAASAGRDCGRQGVTQLMLPLQSVHTKPRFSQAQISGVDACVRTVHVRDFARLDFIPLTQHSRSHRSKTNDVRPCGASPRPPAAPRARSLCEP